MLNKDICKKCWKNYVTNNYTEGDTIEVWDNADEVSWTEGFVACVNFPTNYYQTGFQTIPINEIPMYCPYRLEHIMLTKEE